MAGSGDFSVASGRDKSRYKDQRSIKCFVRFSNGSYREEQGLKYSRFDGANGEYEELIVVLVIQKLWSCD